VDRKALSRPATVTTRIVSCNSNSISMSNDKYLIFQGNKKLTSLHEEGYERDQNHKYLIYADKPPIGFITKGAETLTIYYLGKVNQTLKKWKTDKKLYNVNWNKPKTNEPVSSKGINYLTFAEELRKYNKFDSETFNLPPVECFWLDMTLDISLNFHKFDEGNTEALYIIDSIPQQQYGDKYPIKPILDREGHIFTTFQPQLINRIIRQRKSLIENSENALAYDWILDLRSLINDSISLIDITLNQLYNKAEFSPEPGWIFDRDKVGVKNNRRIKDKLKWIRQISGNQLNIESEFPKLDKLRKIRNHLNHFDPPTVVISLEEATSWINDVLHLGIILIKIREAINAPISSPLIELICQKEAKFNPEKAFIKRLPLVLGKSGYSTSIWKDEEDEK